MSSRENLVSFIIATYNEEKYIAECVDSCLNQTHRNIEIVVTDDGSTDKTYQVLSEKYSTDKRVEIFRFESNRKKIAAFNNSFSKTKGEFIAIIDGDDINLPDRISEQIKCMNRYDLCFCGVDLVNADNSKIMQKNWLGKHEDYELSFDTMILNPWAVTSILMKRNIAEKIFPLPEDMLHQDWWIPLVASHEKNILFQHKSLYRYRIHDNNSSGLHSDFSKDRVKLLQREIRDLNYFRQVKKFLVQNNLKKYFDFIDLKISLLEILETEFFRNKRGNYTSLRSLLDSIHILQQEALPVKYYENMLLHYLDKFLFYELKQGVAVLLKHMPPTGKINQKEYLMSLKLGYRSIPELRQSLVYRLLKLPVSLKRKFLN